MAKAYKARAVVLSQTKLGETDAIVTMLSEEGGQIRAVAKGLRKPGNRIGGRLEPFSVVDVLLHPGRSLDVVGEASCEASNAACREELLKPASSTVVAEFLDKLTRDGASVGSRVFELTVATYGTIASNAESQAALLAAAHLVKAMAMQGLRPATRECALCGKPLAVPARFDVEAGGCLCGECAARSGSSAVPPDLVRWVETLLGSTLEELSRIEGAPSLQLLEFAELWMREHLSLNLKSFTFLKQLL